MEDLFPSSYNDNLVKIRCPNMLSEKLTSKQEESPFLPFPSPFLDDISTQILTQEHPTSNLADPSDQPTMSSPNNALDVNKRKKRRGTGRKDRHSKIRTAQGLRDRRIRLSLQIAPKFFNLQDILGCDKASKTIEWLFSKSKNAIKELTEGRSESPFSECELESTVEIKAYNAKVCKGLAWEGGNSMGEIKTAKSRKSAHCFPMVRQSRDKARARARERTRGRMIIKHLLESKQWFEGNPNNFDHLELGFSENPTYMEELGLSSPFEGTGYGSSYSPEDNSPLEHLQLANVENYLGTASWSTYCSMIENHAVPGWLNFGNKFQGFLGDCNAKNLRINSNSHGMTNIAPLTGNVNGQNPSSIFMSTSNVHF